MPCPCKVYGDYAKRARASIAMTRGPIDCFKCTSQDMRVHCAGTDPWAREKTLLYFAAGFLLLGHWHHLLWALSNLSPSQLSTIAAVACASAALWRYLAAHRKGWTMRAQETWYQVGRLCMHKVCAHLHKRFVCCLLPVQRPSWHSIVAVTNPLKKCTPPGVTWALLQRRGDIGHTASHDVLQSPQCGCWPCSKHFGVLAAGLLGEDRPGFRPEAARGLKKHQAGAGGAAGGRLHPQKHPCENQVPPRPCHPGDVLACLHKRAAGSPGSRAAAGTPALGGPSSSPLTSAYSSTQLPGAQKARWPAPKCYLPSYI